MLQTTVRDLDDDLCHIERTLRRGAEHLRVEEPLCVGCGYVFRGRAPKRFRPPGRCPSCRGQRIDGPHLWIE